MGCLVLDSSGRVLPSLDTGVNCRCWGLDRGGVRAPRGGKERVSTGADTRLEWYAIWAQCQPCREAKGGKIKEKKWTHVVGTYDGKASRLYQDGKFVIESKPGPNSDLLPSNKSLSIGVRGDTKDVHWMAGVIDEAAIFDTTLSLKEIQTIFKSPNGLKGAGLAVGSPQSKLAVTWGQLKGQ